MSDRPLTAAEKALWQRLIETVEPLDAYRARRAKTLPVAKARPQSRPLNAPITAETFGGETQAIPLRQQRPVPEKHGLDGHWDRRLIKGQMQPDVTVDLHGYSLTSAHGRLDSALELSIAAGHRAILLITGKPRSDEERRTSGRGAIRAAVTDWLAASRHASRIAAVRRAHPRHGGSGALYIILKRQR